MSHHEEITDSPNVSIWQENSVFLSVYQLQSHKGIDWLPSCNKGSDKLGQLLLGSSFCAESMLAFAGNLSLKTFPSRSLLYPQQCQLWKEAKEHLCCFLPLLQNCSYLSHCFSLLMALFCWQTPSQLSILQHLISDFPTLLLMACAHANTSAPGKLLNLKTCEIPEQAPNSTSTHSLHPFLSSEITFSTPVFQVAS